jgi:hypothetical protein
MSIGGEEGVVKDVADSDSRFWLFYEELTDEVLEGG